MLQQFQGIRRWISTIVEWPETKTLDRCISLSYYSPAASSSSSWLLKSEPTILQRILKFVTSKFHMNFPTFRQFATAYDGKKSRGVLNEAEKKKLKYTYDIWERYLCSGGEELVRLSAKSKVRLFPGFASIFDYLGLSQVICGQICTLWAWKSERAECRPVLLIGDTKWLKISSKISLARLSEIWPLFSGKINNDLKNCVHACTLSSTDKIELWSILKYSFFFFTLFNLNVWLRMVINSEGPFTIFNILYHVKFY